TRRTAHSAPRDTLRTAPHRGEPMMRDRTAVVVVPPSRSQVILVSRGLRYPLRGRYRMPVTRI
ncbi:hypothetical protein ACFUCQ_27670, partial [Streptomyces sp. NPDC057197]|uniref:hypothetical protein n=1 Tax=Streptomyces sp. NPDC057197 TaxID=3346045 RepID=UPI00363E3A76